MPDHDEAGDGVHGGRPHREALEREIAKLRRQLGYVEQERSHLLRRAEECWDRVLELDEQLRRAQIELVKASSPMLGGD